MRESICTQCHVNNLARTESFWVFSPGFSSLITTSQILSSQTSIYIFSKQRIVCPSNRTSIGHGLPSVFQLQSVYACQCVGASVAGCVRDIICVAEITLKFIDHALIVYNGGLLLFRGENLADLLRLKDRLDFHSNFCAQILHF